MLEIVSHAAFGSGVALTLDLIWIDIRVTPPQDSDDDWYSHN